MTEYTNFTLAAYDSIAEEYFEKSIKNGVPNEIDLFLENLPSKGMILDLGCGSGRDSKYFKEHGYSVVAIDGSIEMAKKAEKYIGQSVYCCDFLSFNTNFKFDGIWANASLHHLKPEEMQKTLETYSGFLKNGGVIGIFVKEGSFEGYSEDNRFYHYYSYYELKSIIESISGLTLAREVTAQDGEDGEQQWIFFLCKKN